MGDFTVSSLGPVKFSDAGYVIACSNIGYATREALADRFIASVMDGDYSTMKCGAKLYVTSADVLWIVDVESCEIVSAMKVTR